MEFRKVITEAQLQSPLTGFEKEAQPLEYRFDPLTNMPCRINMRRAQRVRQAEVRGVDTGGFVTRTRRDCFFCPENIDRSTPLLPESIFGVGRITEGECVLFPNLFPFAEYHAVARITREHYLELDQYTEEMIGDNLKACQGWMLKAYEYDPEARYPMYNWNLMPPSAASIVHPHAQALLDKRPTPYLRLLLEKSRDYCTETGRNYWSELVSEERRLGERFIAENDSLSLIASFAPQGNREILIIFKGIASLSDLDEKGRMDFAAAILGILSAYKEMGVSSFNLSTFSGPIGEKLPYYSLNAKFISRPPVQPFYTSDSGFMERFQYESIIETIPERVAEMVRERF